jgi:hypothetical protein
VLTAAPVPVIHPNRVGTSVSTAGGVRRRPAKRFVGDGQVTPRRGRFTRWASPEARSAELLSSNQLRRFWLSAGSAQIWMLFIAAVVIAHPLRITHNGGVVTRNLQ